VGIDRKLHLVNGIGMCISIDVGTGYTPYDVMRTMGAEGWASGEPPDGGWVLPLAMADKFDWRLIGARHFVIKDGDSEQQCVERLGQVWKRRHFPENKARKMPECVAYSRGARGEERDETKEQKDDYVWLISFKFNGPIQKVLCVPTERVAEPPAEKREAEKPADTERGVLNGAPGTISDLQAKLITGLLEQLRTISNGVRNATLKVAMSQVGRAISMPREELSEREAAQFILTLQERVNAG